MRTLSRSSSPKLRQMKEARLRLSHYRESMPHHGLFFGKRPNCLNCVCSVIGFTMLFNVNSIAKASVFMSNTERISGFIRAK
jgi:hypothetical protein